MLTCDVRAPAVPSLSPAEAGVTTTRVPLRQTTFARHLESFLAAGYFISLIFQPVVPFTVAAE